VQAIHKKCAKAYRLDGDEAWLLLLAGSPSAPASTFIFPPFIDLTGLAAETAALLTGSVFARRYPLPRVASCGLQVGAGVSVAEGHRAAAQRPIPDLLASRAPLDRLAGY
jgi:hypothetical protein